MDTKLKDIEFLPDDFEFVGDKQDISMDVVAPAKPAWQEAIEIFAQNKGAVIGLIMIIIIVLLAIFAPMLSSWKFDDLNTSLQSISPNLEHWFGTDTLGRDLWVRLWTGARISLFIAVCAVFIDVIVGTTYGLISGYFGGMVDSVMQRIQEIIYIN